jgi:hypothetical protein
MSDKTLKLKVTLDSTQVGAEAKKSAQAIDETTAKAEKLAAALDNVAAKGRAANKATVASAEGGAALGYSGLNRGNGIKLSPAAAMAEEAEKTAHAIRGLGSLERVLGISGVESTINLVRSLPTLIAGLSATTAAAGAAIGASLVPIYVAFKKYQELVELRQGAVDFFNLNTQKTLESLHRDVSAGRDSGAFRGDRGDTLDSDIRNLEARRKFLEQRDPNGDKKSLDLPLFLLGKLLPAGLGSGLGYSKSLYGGERDSIAAEEKRLIKEREAARQADYAIERATAQDQAAALEQQQQVAIEREKARTESYYAHGLISRRQYTEALKLIEDKTLKNREQNLQEQERLLNEQLAREIEKHDKQGEAITRLGLQKVANLRKQGKLTADANKENIDLNSPTGSVFRPTPVNTDDLARIGLFVGGGGQSTLMQAQLDELKRITLGLQRVEVATKNN